MAIAKSALNHNDYCCYRLCSCFVTHVSAQVGDLYHMLKFNPTVAVLPQHKVSRENTEILAKHSTFYPQRQCQCQIPPCVARIQCNQNWDFIISCNYKAELTLCYIDRNYCNQSKARYWNSYSYETAPPGGRRSCQEWGCYIYPHPLQPGV